MFGKLFLGVILVFMVAAPAYLQLWLRNRKTRLQI